MVETTADTIDTHDTKHYSDDEIEQIKDATKVKKRP